MAKKVLITRIDEITYSKLQAASVANDVSLSRYVGRLLEAPDKWLEAEHLRKEKEVLESLRATQAADRR